MQDQHRIQPHLCKVKILLIEDEPELRRAMRSYLQEEGFAVESAGDFAAAMERVELHQYDAVLVDLTLPRGSGMDVVRALHHHHPSTGVIIVSAKGSPDERVQGLEMGADDYLAKPFHMPELVARLRALIRRKHFGGNSAVEVGGLRIVPGERKVEVNGHPVELTSIEFDLLLFLVMNKDRVLSRGAIVEHVWGDMAERLDRDDFLYSHIKNLRRKLVEQKWNGTIRTVYGLGYRFNTEQ